MSSEDFGAIDDEGKSSLSPRLGLVLGQEEPTQTIDLNTLFNLREREPAGSDIEKVSFQTFTKLLQALSVPTILVARTHVIAFVNSAFLNITGGKQQSRGASFSALFTSPRDARQAQMLLEKAFSERRPQVREQILRIHDKRIWGRIHLRTLRLGREQMVLVQIENLTAQKELLTFQKYKKLVKIFPIGIAEFALPREMPFSLPVERLLASIQDARVVDGNGEFAAMYRRQAMAELVGVRMGLLFPCTGKGKQIYEQWIMAGFPIRSFETKETMAGNKRQFFENTFIGNVSKQRLLGFWWLKRDITEKKTVEHEMLKAQKIESLGILAGGIAHDFNNLLTGVLGNVSFVQAHLPEGDKLKERLADALKASSRAQDLTRQLLTFSRGGTPIRKICDLRKLITEAGTFASRGSNVFCSFDCPDDLWPVEVDEGQIGQVVSNLVMNAVQSMPGGGTIFVGAENLNTTAHLLLPLKEGPFVRVSVKDHGCGISTQDMPNIFDPYFTTKTGGTGLGLAMAYSIVKKHGGLISASSEPGIGTTFSVFLPAAREAVLPGETVTAVPSKPAPSGRILVMDDDEIIRALLHEMLSEMGYQVALAREGREAVELYRKAMDRGEGFDVVIADLTIPGGLGGAETIQCILQFDPKVCAVVSSGYSTSAIMGNYREHGFAAVLPKPYQVSDLREVLESVMATRGSDQSHG